MLRYIKTQIFIFGLLILMSSCNSDSKNIGELIDIVEKLKVDENHTFLKTLEPTEKDCETIFTNTWSTSLAYKFSEGRWSGIDNVPNMAMKPDHIDAEIKILSATIEELKNGKTNGLPQGYTKIANRFKDHVTVYGFEYLNDDKTVQKVRTAFFKVNDKWVFFPKIYVAF